MLEGKTTRARAVVTASGRYRLYINGVFLSADNVPDLTLEQTDTIDVKNFLAGGDNAVALSVEAVGTAGAAMFNLMVEIDTSLKYESQLGLAALGSAAPMVAAAPKAARPDRKAKQPPARAKAARAETATAAAPAPGAPAPKAAPKALLSEFRNYGEFRKAVTDALAREQKYTQEVKAVQRRIRGLKYRINAMDEKIKALQGDIQVYKRILEGKRRNK
jgi:hypothetical protein